MPYEWSDENGTQKLDLWAHNSLPARGFVLFIAVTAGLFLLPLVAVLGSPVLWGILPFMLIALAAAWWAMERNRADRQRGDVRGDDGGGGLHRAFEECATSLSHADDRSVLCDWFLRAQ